MTEITVKQLEYFVATLDRGSVTKAAAQCNVTQSAVSTGLGQLQKAVGAKLLLRTRSQGLLPTPAGRALADSARQALALIADMPGVAQQSIAGLRGSLRIGCMLPLSAHVIPAVVEHFALAEPQLDVQFFEGSAVDIQARMANGELDAGVLFRTQLDPDAAYRLIAPTEFRIMLAADHPLAGRQSISFRDVAEEPAILLDLVPTIERMRAVIQMAGVTAKIRWGSVNADTIRSLVIRGLGYSIVNLRQIQDADADTGEVVYLPISDPTPANGIVLAHRPDLAPSAKVLALAEFLLEGAEYWRYHS
ncbi:MAG: LysR family transcriptional regulator [Renibacterium sp.]|nr:LysR family transcriptional regulator [Renibacterium sp.]